MLILLFINQVYWLDEIVVTATRYPEELVRIPVAVSVIEKDDIEGYLELNDVLTAQPGIRPLNYGFGSVSTVGIRGMPSDETLVLVDGTPINSISTGVGDISFIPVELIERVEIVKGPVSSIYGNNAVGGVINIVTRKDGHIKTGIGSHGFWGLHSSGTIGELFYIGGGGIHWDGERTNDEISRYYLQGGLKFGNLKIGCKYAEKQFGLPGPVPGTYIPEFGNSSATSIFDQEKDHRIIPSLELLINPTEEITITDILYLNYLRLHYETFYRHFMGFPAHADDNYKTASVGNDVQMQYAFHFNNRATVGFSYNYDTLAVHSIVDDDSTKVQYSEEMWQESNHCFGIWLVDRQSIDRFDIFGAIRYDYDSRFDPAFSPAFGVSYLLTDRVRLRSHWGMAYRTPTFNDLYWPNSGNPDLEPEKGMGIEGGVDFFILENLSYSIAGFYRRVTDKIAWIPAGAIWQPVNVNKVESRGMEIEFSGRPNELIEFSCGYTFLNPKQINMEPVSYDPVGNSYQLEERERILTNTPEHSGRTSIAFFFGPLQAGVTSIFLGERYAYFADYVSQFPQIVYNEKKIEPTFIVNFSLALIISNFKVRVGIDNVADCDEPIQFGNSIDDGDYPRNGRSFRFEVSQLLDL